MANVLAGVVGGVREYYKMLLGRDVGSDEHVLGFAYGLGVAVLTRLSYGSSVSVKDAESVAESVQLFKAFLDEGVKGWEDSFRHTLRMVDSIIGGRAPLERLYYAVRDRTVRKRLGAFFTEPAMAKLMASMTVDDGVTDGGVADVLDPTVGGGTLLAAALEALAGKRGLSSVRLWGVDVDPAALFIAYANVAYAAWRLDRSVDALSWVAGRLRLSWNDYILRYRVSGQLASVADASFLEGTFDLVIANPPWVHVNVYGRSRSKAYLSRLPRSLRSTISDVHGELGFNIKWPEISRSQPPIAVVFTYYMLRQFRVVATVLITGTVLKSWNTAGFRLWLTRNLDLGVVEVYCRDLEETSSWPVVLRVARGTGEEGGIDYSVVVCREGFPARKNCVIGKNVVSPLTSPSPAGPWVTPVVSGALLNDITESTRVLRRIGEVYQIYRGVNTNAMGVFVFKRVERIGDGLVQAVSFDGEVTVLEPDLLHVFVRGARLPGFGEGSYEYILLPHDAKSMRPLPEDELRKEYPHTYRWLSRHRRLLERRSRNPRPWYRVMDLSADKVRGVKVAWRKHSILLSFYKLPERVRTVLGEKLVVPDGTIYYITLTGGEQPDLGSLNHRVMKVLAWMTAKPKGGFPYREYYSWHVALLPYDRGSGVLDGIYERHKEEVDRVIAALGGE